MGDLRVNALDITFNAVVQRMQKLHAPDYDVRLDAAQDAMHMNERYTRTGIIFIQPPREQNHIFGSDGVNEAFEAWRASAKIRRYRGIRTLHVFDIMLVDMLSQYGTNPDHVALLSILIIDTDRFFNQFGFYPDPYNEWVKGKMRSPVETE